MLLDTSPIVIEVATGMASLASSSKELHGNSGTCDGAKISVSARSRSGQAQHLELRGRVSAMASRANKGARDKQRCWSAAILINVFVEIHTLASALKRHPVLFASLAHIVPYVSLRGDMYFPSCTWRAPITKLAESMLSTEPHAKSNAKR